MGNVNQVERWSPFPLATLEWRLKTEEAILGACLLDKNAYPRVSSILLPQTFVEDTIAEFVNGNRVSHRHIWKAIATTYASMPVDIITVTRTILNLYECKKGIGWVVSRLTDSVASSENIEVHALLLMELAIRERALWIAENWIAGSNGGGKSDLIDLFHEFRTNGDIIFAINQGVKFLDDYGYSDEAEDLRELQDNMVRKFESISYHQKSQYLNLPLNALKNE